MKKLFKTPIPPKDQADLIKRWIGEFQKELESAFRSLGNNPAVSQAVASGGGSTSFQIDTDVLLGQGEASDSKVPSQLAVKTYVDVGLAAKLDTSVWAASAAFGITSGNIANWDAAYGWGNHAEQGYLTESAANLLYLRLNP